jgi:hypothetical protein
MKLQILLGALLYLLGSSECSQVNLTFMFISSYGRFGFNSSGAIPAADMALEDINSNANMLPGYNLVYDRVRDSQVGLVDI